MSAPHLLARRWLLEPVVFDTRAWDPVGPLSRVLSIDSALLLAQICFAIRTDRPADARGAPPIFCAQVTATPGANGVHDAAVLIGGRILGLKLRIFGLVSRFHRYHLSPSKLLNISLTVIYMRQLSTLAS